jgi:electron transfer flavoprotein alpha subunit
MGTLVFLENHGNELQKGSLGVLAKAASLGGGDVAAVIAGEGAKALAAEAGKFGAAKVWVCEDDEVAQPLPQARVDVLAQVVEDGGYDTVLFANSVLAADVASGLAARLDAGLNWDLVDLERKGDDLVGKRPALQDSVYADVGWTATPRLALFRAGSFDATPTGGGEPEIADVSPSYAAHSTAVRLVGQDAEESSGPSIEDADVIVAGGRGLGSPEPSARLARSSTPAGTRTRPRSARPARPSRRSCTSPSASPAPSSTRSACRAPARSSRSTRTRTRRFSSSATSAWWATCTRSCPS